MQSIPGHSLRWALVAALALATVPALAQPGPHGHGHGHGPGPDPGGFGLARMFDRLDLTEDQQGQIDELMADRHAVMKDKADELRARRMELADAVHAAEFDEAAIRDAARAVGQAEADLAVERASLLQAVLELLTPDQRAEAREMMDEHRARMSEVGPRWHGNGPFPGPGHHAGRDRGIDD